MGIVVWLVDPTRDGYQRAEMDGPLRPREFVDVVCKACVEPRPRLARFIRMWPGGPVGVQPFHAFGELQGPAHFRRNGVLRWRLKCPHGHDPNITLAEVTALLDAGGSDMFPSGVPWHK